MSLPDGYKWEAFKKATNIKLASRGKKMEKVDESLKSYWEGIRTRCTRQEELSNLLAVVAAVNTWIKEKAKKKAKHLAGSKVPKEHFVTRHNTLVGLAKACLAEAKQLAGAAQDPRSAARVQYEQRKMKTTVNQPQRALRGLQGTYAVERAGYLEGGKQANPVSASTVHDIHEGTEQTPLRLKRDEQYADLFTKEFDQLTTADFVRFDNLMTAMEQTSTQNRQFKHHVCFLRKTDRLLHMVLVDDNGLLTKADGRPADTGGIQWLYAMDEYANLFILEADKYKADGLRTNHSSILAGKDVICAGELEIQAGVLTYIANTSGHYKPEQNNLYQALCELQDQGVPLNRTKCDISVTGRSGWRDLTAQEVLQAQGNLTTNHAKWNAG